GKPPAVQDQIGERNGLIRPALRKRGRFRVGRKSGAAMRRPDEWSPLRLNFSRSTEFGLHAGSTARNFQHHLKTVQIKSSRKAAKTQRNPKDQSGTLGIFSPSLIFVAWRLCVKRLI
ncbi:MAG TPA: hypothetical protein PKC13_31320, partial [Blastocatellia bacterium]|nr:hypothetical protein [Blastocatellia bacterium]